jgi:hypothetical protein
MRRPRKQPLLAAALAAGLAPTPALACDVAEMHAIATEACTAAIGETGAVLAALERHATEAERAMIERHLTAARVACAEGNAGFAAVAAARLARLAGRIESRVGDAPPIWPQQDAGLLR